MKHCFRSLLFAGALSGFLSVHGVAGPAVAEAPAPAQAPSGGGYASSVKVETLLQTSETVNGEPIVYPTGKPEVRVLLVELPPGASTGWHTHPTPSAAHILSGELSVETKDKGAKTYRAGDTIAEMVGTLHNGTNHGTAPVRLLMFMISEQGTPTAERPKEIKAPEGVK